MFLMWLGEQMTERGIGNGISLLIFAGIVAGLPAAVVHTLGMANNGELSLIKLLMVFGLVLAVTAFVVFMERAQRRITVNYARRSGGQKAYQNQSSNLPLKINMAGVIPPIFASSLLMFPATAVSWFSTRSPVALVAGSDAVAEPGQSAVRNRVFGAGDRFRVLLHGDRVQRAKRRPTTSSVRVR